MNSPNLSWRTLSGGQLTVASLFDAGQVDAGMPSNEFVFYLINNYPSQAQDANTYGQLKIEGILSAAALDTNGLPEAKYFDFSTPRKNYRMWFDVKTNSGASFPNNPPPSNLRTLIRVSLDASLDDAALVATAIKNALEGIANETQDYNFDGDTLDSRESVDPFVPSGVTIIASPLSITATVNYFGFCRTPGNGTTGFTITQPATGSGGDVSDAVSMALNAIDATGFSGVADGSQAELRVQFGIENNGAIIWGAYDSVTNSFKSDLVEGTTTTPNAFYVKVGTSGGLASTRIYPRGTLYNQVAGIDSSGVGTAGKGTAQPASLVGKYIPYTANDATTATDILNNYKFNYAMIKLKVVIKPSATAGQLDFITRATYSYT